MNYHSIFTREFGEIGKIFQWTLKIVTQISFYVSYLYYVEDTLHHLCIFRYTYNITFGE